MKEIPFLCLLLASLLGACSQQKPAIPSQALTITDSITPPAETETISSEPAPQETLLVLSVNGNKLNVCWEDNETVKELLSYTQTESIVVNATRYGGFEQVGSLPQGFTRSDVQLTTEPGDIVLYSGDQLVLFFGSNSWSYTKLGHIEGLSQDALSELLGGSSAVIEIHLN
ncbi:MAG: cyclophilin-like fold protein [Eubacteriales bacterium]|nr:cyclophilin-like fold protein [Eubacteriales bacterium]